MTSYTISAGYRSFHSLENIESNLKKVVLSICEYPETIIQEAFRVEGITIDQSYAELYRHPFCDLTIQFVDEDGFRVVQCASGGGGNRYAKEAMRRAVCRMVMERMHKEGMEININVG